ncbi:EAL domain-containing protein [Marinomonas ostreistagni]|uniref:EAL domain-containing protein n=1 Tax=Marinomonas ostreistagni TaxID=359209 RepID=UPI00194EBD9C|nr:EAL domain-containing protein [Marinomonas ostreistagni]MBM6551828.1 EAL domain-containing protein [Marinomonas ostreistagni]
MLSNSENSDPQWRKLQETDGCFLVLDRNDQVVFCNETLQAVYSDSLKRYFPPFDCFWLESEKRTLLLSEFKTLVGKTIDLLVNTHQGKCLSLRLKAEEVAIAEQNYLLIREIKDDSSPDCALENSSKSLLEELIVDLENDKLSLCYQPQLDTKTQQLYGIETLARWQRSNGEFISPDVFVALAEQYNFIAMLDLWVFDKACQQFAEWREKGLNIPMLAVNFSPTSFNYPALCSDILAITQRHQIPPNTLTIEITEGQKIQNSEPTFDVLLTLQEAGFNISLDDFGMGFSNFNRLAKFPISQLKLDRSFVFQLPDTLYQEISISILLLGKSLDLVVIAEGVETKEQLELLESYGYQVFQGYLFAKPLTSEQLEKWLTDFTTD